MTACPTCAAPCPEGARFCPACGLRLVGAPAGAVEDERRPVTAVFVDLVGSTATTERLDVEDVRALLRRFHVTVTNELERHGGEVEKYIGDAVVAVFGARVAHEDDPLRAVRAALAARDEIARVRREDPWLELHLRLGVNTGEALVAMQAARDGPEGVVTGDVMNTAARIQSAAPVDGVLVGVETFRATRHAVRYRRAEPVAAKGKSAPVEVWEALAERTRPMERRSEAALAGRDAELATLRAGWLTAVETRVSRVLTVTGPAGAGKSRLVAEALSGFDAVVLRGRCLAYGEGITYWPLVEAFASAAGARVSDEPEQIALRLAALVDRLGREAPTDQRVAVRRALAALFGISRGGETATGPITQGELHWSINRLLEWLAGGRPLVVVVEDVHWAEPTLLELLRSAGGLPVPLLVLCTARIEAGESVAGSIAAGADGLIELSPLADDAARQLVDDLLGVTVPPDVRELLVRRAGGNPLFLEETVRAVAAGGLLDAGLADVEALPVPAGLQALVGARLDRLPDGGRRILGAASVVGTVFWGGALAALAPGEAVEPGLAGLLDEEVIHLREEGTIEGEPEYVFHHDVIRDVAYARLPKATRAGMHARCADWVEQLPGAPELVEIAAFHLERACLLAREIERAPLEAPVERAVAALVAAAGRSERREGFSEAERFLGRALALLAADDPARDALAVRRCGLEIALGRLDSALDALTTIVADEAVALRSPSALGGALVWLANVHEKQGRRAEARDCLERAAVLARELDDAEVGARAAYELSAVLADFDGHVEQAIVELARGLELAAATGDAGLELEGHLRMGFLLFSLGRLDESEVELRAVVEAAEGLGRIRDAARARVELAHVNYFRGADDEAEALAREAHPALERAGDTYFVAQNLRALSRFALGRDDAAAAASLARDALAVARAIGGWAVVEVEGALVDALLGDRRVEDAAATAVTARADLPADDPGALTVVLVAEAAVAAATGDVDAARAGFAEAVAIIDARDQPLEMAEVRIAFARAMPPGDDPEVAASLAEARAISERVGADGLLRAVERLASASGPARSATPGGSPGHATR